MILKDDDFDEFDIKIDDDNEDGNDNANIVVINGYHWISMTLK